MSDLARGALAPARAPALRPLLAAAGLALGAALLVFVRRVAPDAPGFVAAALAGLAAAGFATLAALLEEDALVRWSLAVLGGLAATLLGALVADAETRLLVFGLTMAALMAGLAYALARAAARRPRFAPRGFALIVAIAAGFLAYGAYIVVASRDLMIADFMTYRNLSIAVAQLIGERRWAFLLALTVGSVKEDYSWLPALAPGVVLAAGGALSRALYSGALIVFYAVPAYLALGVLARDLARRAGAPLGRASLAALGLAGAASFAAYPAGVVIAARGMPDVGGLALVVVALRLADRLARLLALPRGHDARVGRLTRRVALALALTAFAMFVFRRWYGFEAVGIAAILALEIGLVALRRGAAFRWREAAIAAAVGALTLLALASPILVDWLPNLGKHAYASTYSAYLKPPGVVARLLAETVGALPTLLALAAAVFLFARSSDRRLLRLTLGASLVAALLFSRVQSPYAHHLFLLTPALAAPLAAALVVVFAAAPRGALAALAALAALTLSPLAAALAPYGLAPPAGLPRPPRADLAELARMRAWVDARARPDFRVCGLGSSYTFSGQLIGELWQLEAKHSPINFDPAQRTDVAMSDVDTVEGPPAAGLKDCAILIVGDPLQTHINPDFQQTVVVPAREMLSGEGIGAKYRRSGEVFQLENGVKAVVFERIAPLDDVDIAGLQARWRAARAAIEGGR